MPQLDKLTIVTQITWLVVVFFGLYLFFLYSILPRLGAILKFRARFISLIIYNIEWDKIDAEDYKFCYEYYMEYASEDACNALDRIYFKMDHFSKLVFLSSKASIRMKKVNQIFFDELVSIQLKKLMLSKGEVIELL